MQSKKYYIWGTGYIAEQMNSQYKEQLKKLDILGYLDNNKSKVGNVFFGKKVYSPDVLLKNKNSYIIIANTFEKEIISQIEKEYPWSKDKVLDLFFLKKMQLICRYESSKDIEINNIVNFLQTNPLQVFNYTFTKKYNNQKYNIMFDEDKKLYYTYYCNKKMFFSRSLRTKEAVEEYYRGISIEQDVCSPHRYLTDDFYVQNNAVVIDAGVAEGNFSLSIIDNIKKLYLFEPDDDWMEALKYTFEPFKDKVIFINKGLSNYLAEKITTIDNEIKESHIDFIKMDIEGEEYYALQGGENVIISSKQIQCLICVYHQEFAYEVIKNFLLKHQFNIEVSKGYMCFFNDVFREPTLRHGIIRAKRK